MRGRSESIRDMAIDTANIDGLRTLTLYFHNRIRFRDLVSAASPVLR